MHLLRFHYGTCCNKSLSSGFHTDHSLDWACFSLSPNSPKCFMPQFHQHICSFRHTLCSFYRGSQTAIREALLPRGTWDCLFVTGDWQLQVWIPGMAGEHQYQCRHLYSGCSFIYIPKKEHRCFLFHITLGWVLGDMHTLPTMPFTFWSFGEQSWNSLCSSSCPIYHDHTFICKELKLSHWKVW